MSLTVIFFIILGAIAIASAITTVASKNPIISAMSLVVHFFMLAGLYLTLNAQFVAIIQILVYAGAIMVLVIFVIMLLNLKDEEKLRERFNFRKGVAVLFAIALVAMFLSVYFAMPAGNTALPASSAQLGSAESIGRVLFSDYLVPFEAISLLLVLAIIGALTLAKRRID